MSNDKRYDVWCKFLERCNKYFVSIDDAWNTNFEKLKEFIETNKKQPLIKSKNKDEKFLSSWSNTQNQKYKTRKDGMSYDKRYDVWTVFLEQYNEYIDVWNANIDMLKEFIDINKKMPSTTSKNGDEKALGTWLQTQNTNYKNMSAGMKNDERCNEWKTFKNEYLNKIVENKPIKSMELVKPIQPKTRESPENRRIRTKSQMEILHKRYKTLTSSNLNKEFKENTQLWNEYHKISEKNEDFLKIKSQGTKLFNKWINW